MFESKNRPIGRFWKCYPLGPSLSTPESPRWHRRGPVPIVPLEPEPHSAIPSPVMHREATVEHRLEPRQEILRAAARLFQQQGYDATSMNDVAAALKLSKGGLYHHFQSKDEILFHIMSHAMDITEERVIKAVRRIDIVRNDGTEERLRTLIRLHIQLVLSPEDREITVMLHE